MGRWVDEDGVTHSWLMVVCEGRKDKCMCVGRWWIEILRVRELMISIARLV